MHFGVSQPNEHVTDRSTVILMQHHYWYDKIYEVDAYHE